MGVFALMTFRGSFRRFRFRSLISRCARSVYEVITIVVKYSFFISIKMLEACLIYETGILDRQGFEVSNDPVWILGRQYDTKTSMQELTADVKSRLWMTYRRNFLPIGSSGMTTDKGWGCMLRCGQMVIAQALINCHLGRDFKWPIQDNEDDRTKYKQILKMFEDKATSNYSIHQLAVTGVGEGKEVGQWFGPNTVAQVLKKLSIFDEWSCLKIHVALDNAVVSEEIENLCQDGTSDTGNNWNSLLLIIPLRLGLSSINPIYISGLKTCLQMPQSVRMIGGKPSQALYFIGHVGEEVVFLDPHVTQNATDMEESADGQFDDSSYHCDASSRINFLNMDPSLALCFSCTTRAQWLDLAERFNEMTQIDKKQSLFEVCSHRQAEWDPSSTTLDIELMDEATGLDSAESEEEFEILG